MERRARIPPGLLAAAVLALPLLALPVVAMPALAEADDLEIATMRTELARLATDSAELGTNLQLAQAPTDTSRQLAGLVARLTQIEEDLRRLRGRIDQIEYRQQNLESRLGSVNAGPPASATAAPGAVAAAPGTAPAGDATTGPRLPPRGPNFNTLRLPQGPISANPSAPGAPSPNPSSPGAPSASPGSQAAPTGPAPPLAAPPIDTGAQIARIDPNAPPRDQYDGALQLLQHGDWPSAQRAFEGFLQRNPKDALAPNAAYWLGETFYIRKDYTNAAAVFARNYRNYGPESAKAPDNLLKLGMSLAALGDRTRACQTFSELDRRHADAPAPIKQSLVRERAAAGCS